MPVLSIGEKQILSGFASSKEVSNGLFDPALTYGIDIFKREASYGIIRRGYSISDLTGSVIKDTIVDWAYKSDYYFIGNGGYLYKTTGTSAQTTTELDSAGRSARFSKDHYGIFTHNDGSSNKLFYVYGDKIGSFDFDATFTAEAYTGLESAPHPSIEFDGKRFISNGRYVAKLDGATLTLQALALPVGYEVQDLEVYNNYLAVLAYRNLGGMNVECKVFIWDTYSSATQWQYEYKIPERAIALDLYNGDLAIFGENLTILKDEEMSVIAPISLSASIKAKNTFNSGNVLYWQDDNKLMAFGSPSSRIEPTIFSPIGGCGAGGVIVKTNSKYNYFLISTSGNKLYSFKGNDAVSVSVGKTINLEIPRSQITSIEFFLEKLATNDDVLVTIYNDKGATIFSKALTYAAYGAITYKKFLVYSAPTSSISLEFSYSSRAGDVMFKQINIGYAPTRNTI